MAKFTKHKIAFCSVYLEEEWTKICWSPGSSQTVLQIPQGLHNDITCSKLCCNFHSRTVFNSSKLQSIIMNTKNKNSPPIKCKDCFLNYNHFSSASCPGISGSAQGKHQAPTLFISCWLKPL